MRNYCKPFSILDAKAANGVGNAWNVKDYKHVVIAVSAALNSTLTFKFQGSIGKSASSEDAPDFSAPQSSTNHGDYVAAYDLQDPSSIIAGDTGVTLNNASVASNTRLYLVNTDALTWLSMEVSSYTDGSITAFGVGYDNN